MQTGKHYNYFRDYDPAIGRYVESDPIGLDGGINTYGYVDGNSLVLTDETGEAGAAALPPIVRACARFPQVCAVLIACRANALGCKDKLCKVSSALSRYNLHCKVPGCGQADSPISSYYKTVAACTCFVNRVFEKYVCRNGKSDKAHDDEIEKARDKCHDCVGKCTL